MTDLTPHSDDDSPLDGWTLDRLLVGDEPPADDATAPLAQLIADVRRPGDPVELRGQAAMLAAFRESVGGQESEPVEAPMQRMPMLTLMTRSKLVVAATAGALALGAASAAAYTGALPDSMQSVAHHLIKAPSPHAVGPDATGPAAKGLCTAYLAHQKSGTTVSTSSVAFRNLATAAGGAENVATYCATVLAPTPSPTETATPTATDSPTATATDSPTSEPSSTNGPRTTFPGQGATRWTEHGKTQPFPGQGASHWPKSSTAPRPGNGHTPTPTVPPASPTTSPTTAPAPTATN
jgi:hypothetical protein